MLALRSAQTALNFFRSHDIHVMNDFKRLAHRYDPGVMPRIARGTRIHQVTPGTPAALPVTMSNQIQIKRTDAARALETIALDLWKASQQRALTPTEKGLVMCLQNAGVDVMNVFSTCTGEAHDPKVGGMIDHCWCCAPRWGAVGPEIKVR